MSAPQPSERQKLTAAGRVLALLDVFSRGSGSHTLTEISRQSGLSLTTTHRLVRELVAWGGLEIDETGHYRLGAKMLSLATSSTSGMQLREKALPHLADIHRRTGRTVLLGVRDGAHVMYIEALRPHANYTGQNRIGGRLRLHAGAVGLVLLAYADEGVVQEYVENPLKRYTAHTIGDADELRRTLAEVRDNRYAIAPRSLTMAAGSVAAPIVNADGDVEAAVGMVYLVERDDPQRFVELVRSTASRISRSLLQRPGPPSPASVVFLRRESSPD